MWSRAKALLPRFPGRISPITSSIRWSRPSTARRPSPSASGSGRGTSRLPRGALACGASCTWAGRCRTAGGSRAVAGALSLDIAGPDLLTYAEMIERIRDALLLGRPRLDLPFTLTPVAARVAAAIAGEDAELVVPLMEDKFAERPARHL